MISVVMSAYNEKREELRKSVESILNQTYQDIEVIIVSDNPNNDVINSYLDSLTDSRVKVIHNEQNIGLVASLNRALKEVRGEYIARMDADDMSTPDRFEKQLKYLNDNNLDMIGSWMTLIDDSEEDKVIGKLEYPTTSESINKCLKYDSVMPHPTWLGKREVFDKLNGYRNAKYCEDYDFLLRASYEGFKLGNIPEYCFKCRIRSNSVTRSNRSKQLLLSRYIGKNKNRINDVTEKEMEDFINSEKTQAELKYFEHFDDIRADFNKGNNKLINGLKLMTNKYFWIVRIQRLVFKYSK